MKNLSIEPSVRPDIRATLLSRAKQAMALYARRYRTRQAIKQLSDEDLIDIGINVSEAKAEAAKPFWRQ